MLNEWRRNRLKRQLNQATLEVSAKRTIVNNYRLTEPIAEQPNRYVWRIHLGVYLCPAK